MTSVTLGVVTVLTSNGSTAVSPTSTVLGSQRVRRPIIAMCSYTKRDLNPSRSSGERRFGAGLLEQRTPSTNSRATVPVQPVR
jgi:hypothetical protein